MAWYSGLFDPLKGERDKLRKAADVFVEAYSMGPRIYPPEMLVSRLQEMDSRYLDLMTRQIQQSTSWGVGYALTEQDRVRMVDQSRRFFDNDPVTSTVVGVWTDFGFGLRLTVSPRGKESEKAWRAFWTSTKNSYLINDRRLHELSNQLLVDGDYLLLFFISKVDGSTIMRLVPTEQIKGGSSGNGLVCNPDDDREVLFYRREWSRDGKANKGDVSVAYYPDFRATEEDLKTINLDDEEAGGSIFDAGEQTEVKAMLVSMNTHGSPRGWPLMSTGFPWSSAYKQLLEDRAAVARAVAMYVDKIKADGGQRAIDQISQKIRSTLTQSGSQTLERNPRPTAGSTWIENESADRERMPLSTGAGDAQTDGVMLLSMATSVARIYPHWLGHGDAYRLATASAMERPTLRAFNRYQLFWSSVWSDVAKIVFTAWSTYGGHRIIKDMEIDVSTDSVITANMAEVAAMLDAVIKVASVGLLDQGDAMAVIDQMVRLGLQALGVSNVDEIIGSWSDDKKERMLQEILMRQKAAAEANAAMSSQKKEGEGEPGEEANKDNVAKEETGNNQAVAEAIHRVAEAYRSIINPDNPLNLA